MTRKKENLPAETAPPDVAYDRLEAHQILPGVEFFPTTSLDVEADKIGEIIRLLRRTPGLTDAEKNAINLRALDQFENINPADGIESMLAIQMIGTHAAAVECLSRAMQLDQPSEGYDTAMKYAMKLMTLFTRLSAAFDKHRGKGQQKTTAERVTF